MNINAIITLEVALSHSLILPCVITSDAIILNKCESWINLVKGIIDRMEKVWKVAF